MKSIKLLEKLVLYTVYSYLGISVCDHLLFDQGSSPSIALKFKPINLLCTNFLRFQGRSLWPSINGASLSSRRTTSNRCSGVCNSFCEWNANGNPKPAARVATTIQTTKQIHQGPRRCLPDSLSELLHEHDSRDDDWYSYSWWWRWWWLDGRWSKPS